MSFTYAEAIQTRQTSQLEPIPGKPMVANNGGGFSFGIDKWGQLARFCLLGSQSGTYYVSEKKLTLENAKIVSECLKEDYQRTISGIVSISESGRAPKNSPAIFALAIASACDNPAARALALASMPKVCRFGTALFEFVATVQEMRGWGSALKKGVANWYDSKKPEDFCYQVLKYQGREKWSHKDVMHLCHYRGEGKHKEIQHWVEKGELSGETVYDEGGKLSVALPLENRDPNWILERKPGWYDAVPIEKSMPMSKIWAFDWLKRFPDKGNAAKMIRQFGLTREMIPTELLNSNEVWEALLEDMPTTAMIRNLGNLTKHGIVAPLSDGSKKVITELQNLERMKKSRVHPLAILVALKTYSQGRGEKGSSTWTPVQQVVDALDEAFYASFDSVEPTGKRWMLGIDVSASMSAQIAGMPLSCCEAATALSLVTTHVEPWTFTGRFNTGFEECPFNARTRLDEALRYTRSINGGGTDCSMPIVVALQNKIPVDVFVTLTDSETNYGSIHPTQALKMYRDKMGINAKMITVGMTSTSISIADPEDAGSLDIAGMDLSIPQLMSNFVTG